MLSAQLLNHPSKLLQQEQGKKARSQQDERNLIPNQPHPVGKKVIPTLPSTAVTAVMPATTLEVWPRCNLLIS